MACKMLSKIRVAQCICGIYRVSVKNGFMLNVFKNMNFLNYYPGQVS